MATRTTRKRSSTTVVDLTDVKSGGAISDGRYAAKIVEWEEKTGKDSGEPYIQLTWEITSEKSNGRNVRFDNYSLQPNALWRLKGLLEALEYEINSKGDTEIDWDDIIKDETECIIDCVSVANESGEKYARVVGVFPLSDGNTVDDEKGGGKGKAVSSRDTGSKARASAKSKDDVEEEEERPSRRSREPEEEEEEERPARRGRPREKLRKGDEVSFRDEKNKKREGKITDVDGDKVKVETDDEEVYEIDSDEVTLL
jgi:hypothetical protein